MRSGIVRALIAAVAFSVLRVESGQIWNFSPLNEISPGQFVISRLPFISNVKDLQNFFRVFANNGTVRKKPHFRSENDDNYLYYHGAKLWHVKINGSQSEDIDKMVTVMDVFNLQNELDQLSREQHRAHVTFSATGSKNQKHVIRRYYGTQLWKIHETDLAKDGIHQFWRKYGAEIWNINQDGIDILISEKNTQAAEDYIKQTNFTYNVMIEDVESAIDDTYLEVNNTDPEKPWLERDGTLMDWNRFHDIGDIADFLNYCLENYAEIAQIVTIGRTYNKRNIEVLRISNGNPNNRAILISSGLQARDWLSSAAVTYVISKLLWLWDHSSGNMQNIDWYFLPVMNPDGFQYSWLTDRLWTKNRRHFGKCYGTNLNRNFDYEWGGGGSSDQPCNNFYRGPHAFSEAESKAVKQFIANMGTKLAAYLTIGAYGQVITYPWGDADFVTKNRKDLHKVAKAARMNIRKLNQAEYLIGSTYRMKLAQSGNMADWIQNTVNPKYVFSVFLKDQGRYGYLMPPHYIVESGEETYEIIRTIVSTLFKEGWIFVRNVDNLDRK